MRRFILITILFAVCICVLGSCGNDVNEDTPSNTSVEPIIQPNLKGNYNMDEIEVKEAILNEELAKHLLENVLKLYRENEGEYYLHEYYPNKDNEVSTAYLWSYFGALGMMYQMNRLFPSDTNVREEYKLCSII